MLTTIAAAMVLAPAEWRPLFNGRNLNGWTPKIKGYPFGTNFGNTFSVRDGVIRVDYGAYGGAFQDRFGHLFWKESFGAFRLRVEYRFVGEQCPGGPGWAWRNSGVMILGQDPKTMGLDQSFPVSIEVQFLGSDEVNKRSTGNLCTPGTHVVIDGRLVARHVTDSKSKPVFGDVWTVCEVEVTKEGKITHWVDGVEVLSYSEPQLDENDADAKKLLSGDNRLRRGTISLQSESHPVEFRRVEVKVLR